MTKPSVNQRIDKDGKLVESHWTDEKAIRDWKPPKQKKSIDGQMALFGEVPIDHLEKKKKAGRDHSSGEAT